MQLFEISYAYKFLGGFYLAMAVLHFILYIYKIGRTANLVYAVGMLMVFINFTFTQDATAWPGAHKLNVLTDLAANGALLYFVVFSVISSSRFKKALRAFVWICSVGFVLLVINSQLEIFHVPLEIILRSAIYFVIGVSCIIGVVNRIPNFLWIVMATLFLMLMHVLLGTDLFNVWHEKYPILRVLFLLLGFITPFVAYSNYLAKYLAVAKKNVIIEKLQAEKTRELDQMKSRFFANISHEFRTPLTLILGPLQKRLDETSSSEEKSELNVMHRNASRLLKLVNQLLDLSRIEAGIVKLKCTQTNLNEFIASVASQFSSLASSKNIDFKIQGEDSIVAYFDSDKLEKILINLLSNAFKFTPQNGVITIAVSKRDAEGLFQNGYVQIEVIDDGPGIAAEHQSKIFDRFYQSDNSMTREHEGSGIGLALTKELVELHRGSIAVSNNQEKGSIFSVRLPLGNSHLQADEMASDDLHHIGLQSHPSPLDQHPEAGTTLTNKSGSRILIVEDHADLRQYMRESIGKQYTILEAENGDTGIEMALSEIPDLIISDLMMPKTDGLHLCQKLKEDERTCHIPILLLTAKADLESRLSGFRHGADDYIAKPFNVQELLVRVENMIANRKRLQEKFVGQMSLKPYMVLAVSADEKFLKKSMEIVEKFIGDSNFGVDFFAHELGVSHTQLYRKLVALTGLNPNEFIRHMRLERAAELFRLKVGNVSEVAYQLGFNNLSYFAKIFKEKHGITPTEFLKNPSSSI